VVIVIAVLGDVALNVPCDDSARRLIYVSQDTVLLFLADLGSVFGLGHVPRDVAGAVIYFTSLLRL
jgi:hypothetical protein